MITVRDAILVITPGEVYDQRRVITIASSWSWRRKIPRAADNKNNIRRGARITFRPKGPRNLAS